MKPLNLDNRPCSPISSNCVIWQGPDIPCIKLCAGDTISDVVYKLGTELCTIMDQLNVSNYDLSCLNLTVCPPQDFQELIQLLITKICQLNGIPVEDGKASGCPDCVVSVAPCLIQNGQTTMQLVDYVQMIANRLCSIISEIDSINDQISVINTTLVDLQFQIDNLPTYTLPSITVDCILAGSQPLDVVVQTLMNDNALGYCALIGSTGTPAEINAAVLSQCITDIDQPLAALPAVNTFSAYYAGSWVNAASLGAAPSVANAINNIWIAVCDMYNYVSNLNVSITVQDTNTVDLTYTSGVLTANIADTGWVDLLGFNYYSGVGKPQCRRIGNQIHFRGGVIVPIATPGSPSIVEICTPTSYNAVAGCQVFAGAGGCYINPNGSIVFNNDNSVIPTTILDTLTNFDNTYSLGLIVGTRQINLNVTYGTALTAMFNVGITNDKKLFIAVLKDLEITNTRGSAVNIGTSPLRLITSNVRSGDYVPDYIAAGSDIHNAPSNANFPLKSDTKPVVWPFDCDAGDENQIGGFAVRLDGLIAYVDPCTTDIKSYICK